jgi:hypothetical protein
VVVAHHSIAAARQHPGGWGPVRHCVAVCPCLLGPPATIVGCQCQCWCRSVMWGCSCSSLCGPGPGPCVVHHCCPLDRLLVSVWSSPASIWNSPCEQLLAGLVAGAGSSVVVMVLASFASSLVAYRSPFPVPPIRLWPPSPIPVVCRSPSPLSVSCRSLPCRPSCEQGLTSVAQGGVRPSLQHV